MPQRYGQPPMVAWRNSNRRGDKFVIDPKPSRSLGSFQVKSAYGERFDFSCTACPNAAAVSLAYSELWLLCR
jgi:hypothetical protein